MTTKNAFNQALASTAAAAGDLQEIRRKWKPQAGAIFYSDTPEFKEAEARTVKQVGRVTISASSAGNTRRLHIRHLFRVDGRRTTREGAIGTAIAQGNA
jgi:hypothetical protein